MALQDPTLPTRLVICVDGTQSSSTSNKHGGPLTNIHRIYAATELGKCLDPIAATRFNQKVQYVPGIGAADNAISTDRIQANVFGSGYLKQVQEVYESCCKLDGVKGDEVWLFGFSRGAYVVRAVAGLLDQWGALSSAGQPEFSRDFKRALKKTEGMQGRLSLALSPTVSSTSSFGTKITPRIQFVGVFDTISATNDDAFDISLNNSVKHMRQALALHEDRKALTPEYIYPQELYRKSLVQESRSLVQAWFIGNHNDMGGSSPKAGLGLYPLQWMLLEAMHCGLVIDLDAGSKGWSRSHNPLSVVFPNHSKRNKQTEEAWHCCTANGIEVSMHDLRKVHGLGKSEENYAVKLNSKFGTIRQKKSRDVFNENGILRGYCDWAPQGTIIHPSVYMLLDEHVNVALETKEVKLQRHIEDWRERMLGTSENGIVNSGFWLDDDADDVPDVGAIRVLVCGNTGVGKSTLINKTFGVDVTQSSNRTRGIHDVREEITFEGRPDLIVHDSGGFEAGADEEFIAIEQFLKDKSNAVDVSDRLHIIWFCIDINSPRTLQTATEKLFQAVSNYAHDVPIVVVATKKDDFLDIEFGKYRKQLKSEGKRFDEEACEQHAEEKLRERIETIRTEMETVPGGRLDACVAVSQDDNDSIAGLSKTTSHCFDTDKVRLLYIRAQVTRIDLKIDLALCEVMRRYKRLIGSSTGWSFAVGGSTINQKVSINKATKAIINCFGLPTVSADVAMESLKANVWSTLGTNMTLALAETLQVVGVLGSVALAGIPVWTVSGALNVQYIVPATCRLFLIMACDLILVLARSFKEVTFRASGQPSERDVSAAARNYRIRGYSQHVHRRIKKLVPRRNIAASYKTDKIQAGIENIFTLYKDKLMEDVDLPLHIKGMKIGDDLDDDDEDLSTEADSVLIKDYKEASEALAELEANPKSPVVELDATKPLVELPGDTKVSDVKRPDLTEKLPELPG